MARRFIFSSESVGEGHPDKVCDTISDAVLDACLAVDPTSRVACETYAKSNVVIVGGEITTRAKLDYVQLVRDAVREIGYVNDDDVFHADKIFVTNIITAQSPDIAQGVDAAAAEGKATAEQGAGDQGLMFGYACNETPELMPAPIMFAHRLGRALTRIRKSGKVDWLRPDAKSQVSVIYEDNKPVGISNVVISTQHAEGVSNETIRDFLMEEVIRAELPAGMLTAQTEFLINPTGRFVIGGPQGDTGLTGPQDHRRHLRRLGSPRRRRVLRQGPLQGGPLRRLHGPLGGQKRGRGGVCHALRGPVRLRHRLALTRSASTSTPSRPAPWTRKKSRKPSSRSSPSSPAASSSS